MQVSGSDCNGIIWVEIKFNLYNILILLDINLMAEEGLSVIQLSNCFYWKYFRLKYTTIGIVINDISVEVTITLAILSTTLFSEYIDPTK